MVKTGPFFKRICAHTAMAGFGITWLVGLGKGVSLERIFVRSLLAAALFWMLGAFIARYAFGPYPAEPAPEPEKPPEGRRG
jgi:hypothetical protein